MKELAVIIGRFQVPYLTAGHIDFINRTLDENPNVLIVLGCSPTRMQPENCLTFEMRKQMFEKLFPGEALSFVQLMDVGDDKVWSQKLDELLNGIVKQMGYSSAKVYGGRDSFLNSYSGELGAENVPHRYSTSGTALRQQVCETKIFTDDFRAGVIWAANWTFPTTYPTVDIAIFGPITYSKVLLGRKPTQTKFRFIGGFAEPESDSYEEDAIREAFEETCGVITPDSLEYIGSKKIDDWRYRRSKNKIKTSFFAGVLDPRKTEALRAADDIAELKWFRLDELKPEALVPEHEPLIKMLKDFLWRDVDRAQKIAGELRVRGVATMHKIID